MAWSVHSGWGYGWTLLLALPTAGLYVRLFIIQHDCGHGSYFASRRANQWVGACLGLITLFPFSYWKKTHAVHHGTSGNLDRREFGDVRTLTVKEYRARSRWGRFCVPLLSQHAGAALGCGPDLSVRDQASLSIRSAVILEEGVGERAAQQFRRSSILAVACAMTVGWHTLLLVHVPVVLVAGAMGVWLFYVQHIFERAYWSRRKTGTPIKRRSRAALSTTCRECGTGLRAISATTTFITWRRAFRTIVCARRLNRAPRCSGRPGSRCSAASLRAHEAVGRGSGSVWSASLTLSARQRNH